MKENLEGETLLPEFSKMVDDYLKRRQDELDVFSSAPAAAFISLALLLTISFYFPYVRNTPEFGLLVTTSLLFVLVLSVVAIRTFKTQPKFEGSTPEKFDKYIENILLEDSTALEYKFEDDLLKHYIQLKRFFRES